MQFRHGSLKFAADLNNKKTENPEIEMNSTQLVTSGRMKLAFALAIIADVVQLPVNLAFLAATGSVFGAAADIPLEGLDIIIDIATAFAVNHLLGFDWVLLPSFLIELIPGLDAAPTWTGCVAWVAWKRRKEGRLLPG
jgi:hypothetical protein